MARAIMLPSARINLEKLVVLLVDDNPQSLDILAQVVTGFGVRSIIRSPGGEDARAQLSRDQYDLVITDAQMPGLDGYALTSWIRREAPGQNRFVPVILVTAHTRKTHVTRARDCGANYAITKPIRPKTVLERIYWIAKEDRMFIEVEGHARVYAIADEDLDRENDEKTSAVHFVRFELTPAMCAAVKAGAAVKLGCDHTNYPAHMTIAAETLASLAGDLR